MGVFSPGSAGLVWGGAGERRAFLDWVLFHVKPDYGGTVRRYRHTLRQRNGAIRSGRSDGEVRAWDAELARAGESIAECQEEVVGEVGARLSAEVGAGEGIGPVGLKYRAGFDRERGLLGVLEEGLAGDRKMGWTRFVPHTAEVVVESGGGLGRRVLSRGQGKAASLALLVLGAELVAEGSGRKPVLLIDDFDAERDDRAALGVVDRLARYGGQCHMTTLRGDGFWDSGNGWEAARFHVKQGVVLQA
jgi:DNA replication and repair protein RecF